MDEKRRMQAVLNHSLSGLKENPFLAQRVIAQGKGEKPMSDLTQSELDEIEEFQKYQFDTQLLIEGTDLDDFEIRDYITEHFEGNELLVVGDEELIKIHFHTNEPWLVLAYCATKGDIYDIVVENMFRQAKGLQG